MSIGAAATNAVGLPGPADRQKPNILLTGTPGTGKSCTADLLAEILPFKFINVGKEVREKGFHSGHDTTFDTFVLDEDSEDKLLDYLEPIMVIMQLVKNNREIHKINDRLDCIVIS